MMIYANGAAIAGLLNLPGGGSLGGAAAIEAPECHPVEQPAPPHEPGERRILKDVPHD